MTLRKNLIEATLATILLGRLMVAAIVVAYSALGASWLLSQVPW